MKKSYIKKISLIVLVMILVGGILLTDSSGVMTNDISVVDAESFIESQDYLFPEAKIFIEFAQRVFELIFSA